MQRAHLIRAQWQIHHMLLRVAPLRLSARVRALVNDTLLLVFIIVFSNTRKVTGCLLCVCLCIATCVCSWRDLDDVLAVVFTLRPPPQMGLHVPPVFPGSFHFHRCERLPFTAYLSFFFKRCPETYAPVRVPRLQGPGWYLAHSFINAWQRAISFCSRSVFLLVLFPLYFFYV